ncbi:MAG: inositol monophosphatase family protein [Burkholderiales bacterium]
MEPKLWLPFLQEIADRADAIALKFFRAGDLRVEQKSDLSPVTLADHGIEELARELVRGRHPDLGICGEEQGESGNDSTRLIIDPIDGTKNFVRGIPIFATLLAIEKEGEVIAGFVSAPAMKLRWHAARGSGAYCGVRRLQVSNIASLRGAQLFHANLSLATAEYLPPGLIPLLSQVERTRGFGDFYQHLLVAEGCGEIAIDPTLKPWDIAALQVIVEEAGGRATGLNGEHSIYAGSLLSSNGLLHETALTKLNSR